MGCKLTVWYPAHLNKVFRLLVSDSKIRKASRMKKAQAPNENRGQDAHAQESANQQNCSPYNMELELGPCGLGAVPPPACSPCPWGG